MILHIVHTTHFEYEIPAFNSQNEMRVKPWDRPGQRCLQFELTADASASVLPYRDFFGNEAHSVCVGEPHQRLSIVANSVVEKYEVQEPHYNEVSFSHFLQEDERRKKIYFEFLNASHYVPFTERLRKFFWMAHPAESEDVAAYVMRVVAYVRDQFEYETSRTTVNSSLEDILKTGGGVCQDFAHLTIGILRLAGVPARYVSGYLAPTLTEPSSVTQQASHAWLEAWLPGLGWVGYDPTNRCRADERHIGMAIGRDYNDVPPLRGVYSAGGGRSIMRVDLSIEPVTASADSDQQSQQQQQ
ncbi:MAG: transglutaminase family protein [Candidatus Binataceae bacterium]|jgi:transglutaminase-like putative cysteine protease